MKSSVSPDRKPDETDTVAPLNWPLLSTSLTVSPLSSVTGPPPPVNVTVPPAVTVGATCTVSRVLAAPPVPVMVLPSLTTQEIDAVGVAAAVGRIAVGRAEAVGHRFQRGLVVGDARRAGQNQGAVRGVVAAADAVLVGEVERIAGDEAG